MCSIGALSLRVLMERLGGKSYNIGEGEEDRRQVRETVVGDISAGEEDGRGRTGFWQETGQDKGDFNVEHCTARDCAGRCTCHSAAPEWASLSLPHCLICSFTVFPSFLHLFFLPLSLKFSTSTISHHARPLSGHCPQVCS